MNRTPISAELLARPFGSQTFAVQRRVDRPGEALRGHVHARKLARMRRLATVMDEAFRIPFTKFRFGLDGVVGLIPVLGDTVTALISAYIIYDAARLGVPRSTLLRMGSNLAVDYAIGLLPVLGDLMDAAFKANRKNVDLVEAHLRQQHATGISTAPGGPSPTTPSRVPL